MGGFGAWIAARLSKIGGALVLAGAVVLGVLMAITGIKRRAHHEGREEVRDEEERRRLRQAVEDGERHAEITEAMQDAHVDGPRTRDDVLDRLRNDP
ncbi:hypothetical protein ACFFUB_00390 [Algimonas porphyrae]|uniref:SHOCT domain-containing protein n=1 Tax=Algimonas porphyrae TaxID=1128113 RepID=A0ABQ5V078_9PROT|nr:hypothetical protein [Algimonas porphyrae]GLQ20487.1 hypothetical protein GCM10007854_14420 [Algimonas porphyrae]